MNTASPLRHKLPLMNRQSMYKSPGLGAIENKGQTNESPSWRDAYKKRCFNEFKKSRQKLINRFRNFNVSENNTDNKKTGKFRDYLEEELEKICLLEAQTNSITIDEAIEMYKEIQAELIPAYDDKQLEEIIQSQQYEESILNAVLNNNLHVICPVCQRANLSETNEQIYCKNVLNANQCHFKIEKCKANNIDLSTLSSRLETCVKQHECSEPPRFQFKHSESATSCFLLMSCDKCEFMSFLI